MTEHNSEVLDFPGADRLQAAADVAPPSQAAVNAALEAVRMAAANSDTVTTVASRPRHRTRRILISAAAVAAIAAGVAVYPSVGIGGHPPAAQANAAGFLHQMADTAGAGPASDAPYWKVKTRESYHPNTGRNYPPTTQTEWLSRNHFLLEIQPGHVLELSGLANGPEMAADIHSQGTALYTFRSDHPEQTAWRIGGRDRNAADGKTITWDELKTLPTEPKALRAKLLGNATGPEAESELFNGVNWLLGNAPSGPRLRAALYEVLAESPNLRFAGHVKDAVGRSGTAVDLKGGSGWSSRMIIDPRTSQLLEASAVLPTKDHPTTRITYLSAGPAENAPRPSPRQETPAAGASPRPKG